MAHLAGAAAHLDGHLGGDAHRVADLGFACPVRSRSQGSSTVMLVEGPGGHAVMHASLTTHRDMAPAYLARLRWPVSAGFRSNYGSVCS